MAEFSFETVSFEDYDDSIRIRLLTLFYSDIPKADFEAIGDFEIKDKHTIEFKEISEKKAQNKLYIILGKAFDNLTNSINGNPTTYVHRNSGIPLLGYIGFGITDRGSSLIEVRTHTSCNINCPFCSVDEGIDSRKKRDFVIEKDYLVEEVAKLAQFKNCDMEVNLNPQGEPFMYSDFVELVRGLGEIPQIKEISVNTNGSYLTRELIDRVTEAGLTQINLSLNAVSEKKAHELAGTKKYNIKKILEIVEYIPQKCKLSISPVWLPGSNDEEIESLIQLYKKVLESPDTKHKIIMGIQNFLPYKKGRNPVKPKPMEQFFEDLKNLEQKYGVQLILSKEDFHITLAKSYPKVFQKGDVVMLEIVAQGRRPKEVLAAGNGRLVCVHGYEGEPRGKVKVHITKNKDGIYDGNAVKK